MKKDYAEIICHVCGQPYDTVDEVRQKNDEILKGGDNEKKD